MGTVLENLLKQDSEFSESKFKSKVENTFVQIKLAMVTGKTERIKHFVNDETYQSILDKIQEDIDKNRIRMYDELNVADISIENIQEFDDRFEINVKLHSKALEYFITRDTKKFISGDTDVRTERMNKIVYTKMKDAKALGASRKCPACGADVDINKSGQCEYCGAIFNLVNYDWIITYMDLY